METVYRYESVVTIGDTNVMQNMYFLNFFKLAAVARELWVKDCVPDAGRDLQEGLVLITRDAGCSFRRDFMLWDPIVVELQFVELRQTNVRPRFRFRHGDTGKLHAEGFNTIVFADARHRVTRIPDNWRCAIERFVDVGERESSDALPTGAGG